MPRASRGRGPAPVALAAARDLGREIAAGSMPLDQNRGVEPVDMAPHGGSFPIHVRGTGIVGTVTVSGIPQREDHRFVFECLCEYLGVDPAPLALGPEE